MDKKPYFSEDVQLFLFILGTFVVGIGMLIAFALNNEKITYGLQIDDSIVVKNELKKSSNNTELNNSMKLLKELNDICIDKNLDKYKDGLVNEVRRSLAWTKYNELNNLINKSLIQSISQGETLNNGLGTLKMMLERTKGYCPQIEDVYSLLITE